MAKPNYAFAKRQKELAKKQKKEEKLKRKSAGRPSHEDPNQTDEAGLPVDPDSPDAAQTRAPEA